MPLNRSARTSRDDAHTLIARGHYVQALEMLQEKLAKNPASVHLRQSVADTMVMAGMKEDAVTLLLRLSDDFAKDGFAAKAIAILKKIDRIQPGRPDVYTKLANELPSATSYPALNRTLPAETKRGITNDMLAEDSTALEVEWEEVEIGSVPIPVTTALFESFAPDELLPLMRGLRLVTFQSGDIIVAEGEAGNELFILTTGRVKTFVRNAAGHYEKIREMTDGDFFGEISFLRSTPRTATLTAAAPCEILILDKSTLLHICQTHPHVLEVLEQFCSERENSPVEIHARKSSAIDDRS